ncbi:DNA repair protein RecN [Candidatus Nitronereus thalassa]|uniref:DNA repair protein RecN n=1 Tax=Candidatus Nitronereus thalassa TaxID=3020898 RepID=A0ABU3K4P9_9BACT|nr:DNA repair protein RecN [Candidatus Nitronereus thalassa]MDT7041389.1 DNA repair protein RecN [Candidatus Nitronereus thalassa]
MLIELRISNFALFDQLQLEFLPGFNVLTGETGAGKSLLVDALALLLGGRAVGDQIRSGAEEASLEATFSVSSLPAVQQWLANVDLAGSDSEELLLRRVLSRSGRNRAYINGTASPMHQLQELGGLLIDIHGQHDQQSLLSVQVQLELVDAFGRLETQRTAFEADYAQWQTQQREWDRLNEQSKDRVRREEFLQHEFEELTKADLQPGEEESLLLEHRRLQNSGKLSELSSEAYLLLYEEDTSILSHLQRLHRAVLELGQIDPTAKPWTDTVAETSAQLEELAHACRDYREGIDHDPDRLGQIDERLALLQRLRKKYHETLDGLIARRETLQHELSELSDLDHRLQTLEQAVSQAQKEAVKKAQTLSKSRKGVVKDLQERVMAGLADLKMAHTRFQVQFETLTGEVPMGPTGMDRVEYLFCANPGESLQPLGRVASGGELSRLMLAIKTVLAKVDQVPVLVFDEIDTGVGGDVASVMGQRLRGLGQSHQVFCLTHLPQIASQGSQHFVVEKVVKENRTTTSVKLLNPSERKDEIARMLGGEQLTTTVKKAAAEMLQASAKGPRSKTGK